MGDFRTSTFFDGYAQDFNAIYGTRHSFLNAAVNHFFRSSMRLRYLKTLEGCSPVAGHTVLDVGCGPGHFSIALAKGGADSVLGIDFAEGMLNLARKSAEQAGVNQNCRFEQANFLEREFDAKFDYTILMGLMDYMEDPLLVIRKALAVTNKRAFFSFPLDGGILAWQRKLRYKSRCDLFMYTQIQVLELFARMDHERLEIAQIDRDLFVTAHMK